MLAIQQRLEGRATRLVGRHLNSLDQVMVFFNYWSLWVQISYCMPLKEFRCRCWAPVCKSRLIPIPTSTSIYDFASTRPHPPNTSPGPSSYLDADVCIERYRAPVVGRAEAVGLHVQRRLFFFCSLVTPHPPVLGTSAWFQAMKSSFPRTTHEIALNTPL